ncbi:hypothetical protein, partial [Megasphaera sp.]
LAFQAQKNDLKTKYAPGTVNAICRRNPSADCNVVTPLPGQANREGLRARKTRRHKKRESSKKTTLFYR